jgi:hypothetical protein
VYEEDFQTEDAEEVETEEDIPPKTPAKMRSRPHDELKITSNKTPFSGARPGRKQITPS